MPTRIEPPIEPTSFIEHFNITLGKYVHQPSSEDMFYLHTRAELEQLKARAEEISGEWDGDWSGVREDRSNSASEILEAIETIENALEHLEETDGMSDPHEADGYDWSDHERELRGE